MPFAFDNDKKTITMAAGDTATIVVSIQWDKLTAGDVMLFAVFASYEADDLLCKSAEIVNGQASIRLCNHDTRDIPPGQYKWNLRLVTGPERDEAGGIRADDCSDEVITVFDKAPTFRLTRGGACV